MARFPKGLLFGAALLELMILTTQGHGATEVRPAPLPASFLPVDPDAPEIPTTKIINAGVLGLVRRDPPAGPQSSKPGKPNDKKEAPKSGK